MLSGIPSCTHTMGEARAKLTFGVRTVVTKTKTFCVLADQRALHVSRNAEKNRKNNSKKNSVRK